MSAFASGRIRTEMRIVVYTAIYGGRDTLQPISGCEMPIRPASVPHICFTDTPQPQACGWLFCIDELILSPRREARRHKAMPHAFFPDVDYSIWIDGNVILKEDPARLCTRLLVDHDVATFRHPARKSVYAEAQVCTRLQKDSGAVIGQQMRRYRQEGYPDSRLAETRLVVRRHTKRVAEMNTIWWEQICQGSVRDQLSFNYACWKSRLGYREIPGPSFDCTEIEWRKHENFL
jgi:hypothetical protein